LIVLAGLAGGLALSGIANAEEKAGKDEMQEDNQSSRKLEPVKNAVELTVGTGYAQGFGDVAAQHLKLTDVGEAGGAVQLGVGYRLTPRLALGVYGSGSMFSRGTQVNESTNLYSSTAGIQADWHFLPSGSEVDPWVSLGSGWRGYWMSADQGTTSLQGWQIAKLQVGVDYRIDKAVAISPVIGADLSTFFTESTPASGTFHNLDTPKVNTFLFAGVQGRFDMSVGSDSPSDVASR